ncbi:MAG: outer membrane beta-barrel protein, partial [Alistipes sp.]|nr:outer membrane beta-barrel protein [Alistipes sp.]
DPLYFEFGANMMWGFGKDEEDWYENKLSLLSFNVPLALTYQFSLGEKVKIAPYAGLNLCVHLKGEVDEVDMFGSDYDEGDGDRFNVGGLAGINFTYGKLVLGVGYMLNFTEILQETKLKYPAFSIGIQF